MGVQHWNRNDRVSRAIGLLRLSWSRRPGQYLLAPAVGYAQADVVRRRGPVAGLPRHVKTLTEAQWRGRRRTHIVLSPFTFDRPEFYDPYDRQAPGRERVSLFRGFADSQDAAGALAFVQRFGLLRRHRDVETKVLVEADGRLEWTPGERLNDWLEEAAKVRRAVDMWEALRVGGGQRQKLDEATLMDLVDAGLGPAGRLALDYRGDQGGLALVLKPADLLGAMWLELALAIDGDKKHRQCPACSSWFEIDPDVHRSNAKYCSDACKSRQWRIRKAQTAPRRSRNG